MVLDSQPARTSLTDNLVLSIFFLSFQFSTWHPALCHLTSRGEETYRLKLGEEIEKSQFSRRTKSKCRDKSFERISREGLVRKYWGWIFLRKTCGRRKKKCRKKLETQVRVYLGHGFSPGVGFEEGWRYKLTERKLRACVCVCVCERGRAHLIWLYSSGLLWSWSHLIRGHYATSWAPPDPATI